MGSIPSECSKACCCDRCNQIPQGGINIKELVAGQVICNLHPNLFSNNIDKEDNMKNYDEINDEEDKYEEMKQEMMKNNNTTEFILNYVNQLTKIQRAWRKYKKNKQNKNKNNNYNKSGTKFFNKEFTKFSTIKKHTLINISDSEVSLDDNKDDINNLNQLFNKLDNSEWLSIERNNNNENKNISKDSSDYNKKMLKKVLSNRFLNKNKIKTIRKSNVSENNNSTTNDKINICLNNKMRSNSMICDKTNKKEEIDEDLVSCEPSLNKDIILPTLTKRQQFKTSLFYNADLLKLGITSKNGSNDCLNRFSNVFCKAPRDSNDISKLSRSISDKKNMLRLSSSFLRDNKQSTDEKEDRIRGYFLKKPNKNIKYYGNTNKRNGKKIGYGIVKWSDGSRLDGNFTNSVIYGINKFYNNTYDSYFFGEYEDNIPDGFGIYKNKRLTLQGIWYRNHLNGIGIEIWDDGTYYQGEFEKSNKNGVGLYRWPDGTIYQGTFINNEITGIGIILYNDSKVYSGEVRNGCMEGFGKFTWENGNTYIGQYLHDIKHGFGIFIWDIKPFLGYVGFWEMGKQHGVGAKLNGNKIQYSIYTRGKESTALKGFYEINGYLSSSQKKYYKFFTPNYLTKLRTCKDF